MVKNLKSEYTDRSFFQATGAIQFTLKNDMLFHMVMSKSYRGLKRLICALLGLSTRDVKNTIAANPIDCNESSKEVVLDTRILLNNQSVLNIELQIYDDPFWIRRSLLYLCKAFDSIGAGDNYSGVFASCKARNVLGKPRRGLSAKADCPKPILLRIPTESLAAAAMLGTLFDFVETATRLSCNHLELAMLADRLGNTGSGNACETLMRVAMPRTNVR